MHTVKQLKSLFSGDIKQGIRIPQILHGGSGSFE